MIYVNYENYEPKRTLNKITASQAMSSLQTGRIFFEYVEGRKHFYIPSHRQMKRISQKTTEKPKTNNTLFVHCSISNK